jgi:chemotaxis protein histidine kinase CheA
MEITNEFDSIIEIYLYEINTYVEQLREGILFLESNFSNQTLIQELNRIAHTLKASSRVYGYDEIQIAAQKLEEIFGNILNDNLNVNSALAKKLLIIIDSISSAIDIIVQSKINIKKKNNIEFVPLRGFIKPFFTSFEDMANTIDKKVKLLVTGLKISIHRDMLNFISSSLIHIIRNAIDHGIETNSERKQLEKPIVGTVEIAISQSNDNIVLMISDDGRGINTKKIEQVAINRNIIKKEEINNLSVNQVINFIYQHGFSTRNEVNDISGLGIGLDAVRMNIKKFNGTLNIETKNNIGTNFFINIPINNGLIRII